MNKITYPPQKPRIQDDDEHFFQEMNLISKSKIDQPSIYLCEQENNNSGFNKEVWKKGALRIVYHISKFILQLHTNTDTMRFKMIEKNHMKMINDHSSDYYFFFHKKMFRQQPTMLQQIYHKMKKKVYNYLPHKRIEIQTIEPDSLFKIFFDALVAIVVISNIFYLPFKIAFSYQTDNLFVKYAFDIIPSIVLLLEIILKFNTAYYDKGTIFKKRKLIFYHYMKTDLFLDLIVVIPFLISTNSKYIDFVLLLRIQSVKKIINHIEDILNLKQHYATYIDLFKLIFILLFVAHFGACIWFFIGSIQQENSWLLYYGYNKSSIYTQYVNSLYWSNITLLTIGYGDISPQTDLEKIMVIIMSLITCQVFGYSINSIGSIIKDIEDNTKKQKIIISKITHHLSRLKIHKSLQLKVIKYFEYLLELQKEQDEDVTILMEQLQPDLKSQVMQESFKQILLKSKFFRENLSENFVEKLCSLVHEQKCQPGEVIYNIDDVCNRLYFLQGGQLNIVFTNANEESKVIKKLKRGYVIGEKNFFLNQRMFYKIQCEWFTDLIYIRYDEFLELIKQFNTDYEKFHLTKEQMLFNYKKHTSVCELCGSNHEMSKCALCFHQPNIQKINHKKENNVRELIRRKNKQQKKQNYHQFGIENIQQQALAYLLNENILNETDLNANLLSSLGFFDFFDDHISSENSLSSPKQLIEQTSIQNVNSDSPNNKNETIRRNKKRNLSIIQNKMRRLSQDKKLSQIMELFQQRTSSSNLEKQESQIVGMQVSQQYHGENTKTSIQTNSQRAILIGQTSNPIVEQELIFDNIKSYEIYFPDGNVNKIIEKLEEELYQRNLSRVQSSKILQKIIQKVQNSLPRRKANSISQFMDKSFNRLSHQSQ